MNTAYKKQNGGYIAIFAVLMIAIAGIMLATSASLLGIGEVQSSLSLTQGEGELHFVEGCAEDALWKARASDTYTGGNITRPEGTCTVSISKNGLIWTITVGSTNTLYTRRIQIVVTRNPTGLVITSWKEI
jgi:hypothetical protein